MIKISYFKNIEAIFHAAMTIIWWFNASKLEFLLLFLVLYYCKSNIWEVLQSFIAPLGTLFLKFIFNYLEQRTFCFQAPLYYEPQSRIYRSFKNNLCFLCRKLLITLARIWLELARVHLALHLKRWFCFLYPVWGVVRRLSLTDQKQELCLYLYKNQLYLT